MLTEADIRFFHDNGYLILRNIIPHKDIAALRAVADRLQTDAIAKLRQPGYLERANRLNKNWIEHPDDHYVYREKPDGSYSFHRVERGYTQDPLFRQFAMTPVLLENAWQLLQRPFWPRAGNLVVKLPHEGAEVRWHQDIPYLYWSSGGHPGRGRPTTHAIPNFTTDIYLDSSTRANGCLYAIPGTHKSGTVDVDEMVAQHRGALRSSGRTPSDMEQFILPGAMPLEIEPGDIMFHHVAVVHGSPENHSAALRRTFYIHYMTDETVADAYSDWPDLLSAEENMRVWGAALAARQGGGAERSDRSRSPGFAVTPAGLAPAPAVVGAV